MITLFRHIRSSGQAGMALLLITGCLLLSVATVCDLGEYLIAKVQAQSVADAAALKGAVSMATSINAVGYLNIKISLLMGTSGAGFIPFLKRMQDIIIQTAIVRAIGAAQLRGSHGFSYVPIPLNHLSHRQGINVRLRRPRLLWFELPFVVSYNRPGPNRPYGDRIMRIAVTRRGVKLPFLSLLLGRTVKSPAIAAAAEAAVFGSTFLGLPVPDHKGFLVRPSVHIDLSKLLRRSKQ